MTALYILTNQYQAIVEKLAEGDFDLQTIEDTIEASGIVDEFSIKAQNCEFIARELLAHHDAIDAEITRLTALKTKRDKAAQTMRDYIKICMERAGIEKIECPLFKLSIRKNPFSVEVIDLLSLPAEYWRIPEPKPPVAAPDKTAIKAALLEGKEVTGAKLIQNTRLEIK